MNKIILRNSCIIINDYTLGDSPGLESNFMIFNLITHSYNTFGMYYDAPNRRLYIPRGIDLWKLKKYLNENAIYREPPNPCQEFDKVKLKFQPRDDQQKEALRFMIGIDEYSDTLNEPQISVNLNTGKGKTYCSIATICWARIKSIIITASLTLLNQWEDNILEYTNLTKADIMHIEGSNTLNMILADKSTKAEQAKIFLCSHATLRSFGESYGWNLINNVFMKLGIGIKVFDEAHTNFDNMIMIDFFTNVAKTYYVTATPARSSWDENKVYQLSMKNVPSIDLFNEEIDPHTDYIAIKWNSRPTAQQVSMCRNAYGLDKNRYIDYVTKQPEFYEMMVVIMDLVLKCGGRALMYIGTNEGLLRVYKWIGDNYHEFWGDIGIYTSLVPKEKKGEEKKKKLILSTTKSAGLGEHIQGLKLTIVLAEPFKSEVIARQTLGRTRDPNTRYIELVDVGFKKISQFYYAKLPVFNKYASSVSDTVIDQYELEKRSENLQKQRARKNCPIYFIDNRFFE